MIVTTALRCTSKLARFIIVIRASSGAMSRCLARPVRFTTSVVSVRVVSRYRYMSPCRLAESSESEVPAVAVAFTSAGGGIKLPTDT